MRENREKGLKIFTVMTAMFCDRKHLVKKQKETTMVNSAVVNMEDDVYEEKEGGEVTLF